MILKYNNVIFVLLLLYT